MRHPPLICRSTRILIAAIAFGIAGASAGAGAALAASGRNPLGPPPPSTPPPASAPHSRAPHVPTAFDSAHASSPVAASDPRHRVRDDVVVFGDPFWDPLWDIDADLVLGYAPYTYPPRAWTTYGPTGPARHSLVPIELHVHPWKASVIVDDSTLGEARDYNDDAHPLFLTPGDHLVELQYPGYETLRFTLNVQRGLPRDLHYSLIKGEGMDPRSAEAPPAPASTPTPAPSDRNRG